MNKLPPASQFEAKVKLAHQTQEPDPVFVSQLRELIQHTNLTERSSNYSVQFKINVYRRVWIALVILLFASVVSVVLIGPDQVLAEVQRLVGYIPGIGFVENNEAEAVLVLSEPIMTKKNNVEIVVSSAVSDATNTRINLRVDGISGVLESVENGAPQPIDYVYLRLKDGTNFPLKEYKINYRPFYTIQIDFNPLPANAKEVVLGFTTIPGLPFGTAPENWQIVLPFTPRAKGQIAEATPIIIQSEPSDDIILTLVNAVWTEKNTALQVKLETNDKESAIEPKVNFNLRLRDSKGNIIPFQQAPDWRVDEKNAILAIETKPLDHHQAYTLEVNGPVELFYRASNPTLPSEFEINLGANPRIGQKWVIDKTIHFKNHTINIDYAQLVAGEGETARLIFGFRSEKDVTDIMIFPVGEQAEILYVMKSGIGFKDFPKKPIKFYLGGIFYEIDGKWSIEWKTP